jgi:hypothetical protein
MKLVRETDRKVIGKSNPLHCYFSHSGRERERERERERKTEKEKKYIQN